MTNFELDIRPLLKKFKELSGNERIKAQRAASGKALQLVKEATLKQMAAEGIPLDQRNRRYPDLTPRNGVREIVYKDGSGGSVNIMSNYVLRFLENGTEDRSYKSKNGKDHFTGRIEGKYFFRNARNSTESKAINILNEELGKAIQNIWNKK